MTTAHEVHLFDWIRGLSTMNHLFIAHMEAARKEAKLEADRKAEADRKLEAERAEAEKVRKEKERLQKEQKDR